MPHEMVRVVHGTVLDDERNLTLGQLCRMCRLHAEALIAMGGNSGFGPSYDVSADGQTIVTVRSQARARISVVFNWPGEIARAGSEAR